ncbi:MAG: HAD hydrolase family protein [Patescibacteria group bacterium]|jgi:hydroxymethylpyrimidine pyrophosphatase-like HAD family hydrolase
MFEEKIKEENKEQFKPVEHAWLFDVDGVLTHPSEKKVTEPEIFFQLIKRLEAGEPVALNTGRATDFMLEKIIEPLEKMVANKKILHNLLAVGEKGAVTVTFNDQGEKKLYIDESISVPEWLQKEVMALVNQRFSATMFYDKTKKTMISIEMLDNLELEKFKEEQNLLNQALAELLVKYKLTDDYKIDPSRIATDIENKHVGKHLGAGRALAWLDKKKIRPEQFIAFGDSPSDVAMAEELNRRGLKMQFVFVGERELLADKKMDFAVDYTENHCEKGVIEYMRKVKDL